MSTEYDDRNRLVDANIFLSFWSWFLRALGPLFAYIGFLGAQVFDIGTQCGIFQSQAFYLIVLAAGTATVVSGLTGTGHAVIHAPHFEYPLNHELGFYLLMGLACGMLAVAFIRSFYWLREFMDRAPIPQMLMPLVGGLIVGVTLIFFPQIAASGYETMNAAFSGHMDVSLLLTLVAVLRSEG